MYDKNEENLTFEEELNLNDIDINKINLAFDYDRSKNLFLMIRNILFSNLFRITMTVKEIPYIDLKDIEEKVIFQYIIYENFLIFYFLKFNGILKSDIFRELSNENLKIENNFENDKIKKLKKDENSKFKKFKFNFS